MTIDIDISAALGRIDKTAELLNEGTAIHRAIARMLEAETEANFAAQGRPAWVPLAKSTVAKRMRRNRGSSTLQMLQDRGILAASVSSQYGRDFSLIGAGGAARGYAAIQQFGGTIERAAHSGWVRLRTDRQGNLMRQGDKGRERNLAVFAKEKGQRPHKQFVTRRYTADAYTIDIPARPYLPIVGSPNDARLQPEAERSALEVVEQLIARSLGVPR